MRQTLRIAEVAPPYEPVPPPAYGGTERIIGELVAALHGRGHDVTTFASGDSTVPGRLVPTVPAALWQTDFQGDAAPWFIATLDAVLERAADFDVIHSHVEWYSALLARSSPVPVVTTFHGRLDHPWSRTLLSRRDGHAVAISRAQAGTQPDVEWAGIVHNGLTLDDLPFGERPGTELAFVGRIAPEKGVLDAIDVAVRAGRRLRIAAKSGKTAAEVDYLENAFKPALAAAGSAVDWLGELSIAERDRLYADSLATLMPGSWPEPFGLVAIESMATGTPVVARRVGAIPEIVRDGVDGFVDDDVEAMAAAVDRAASLDRAAIRQSVLERFSADRMTDEYEAIFETVIRARAGGGGTARSVSLGLDRGARGQRGR
jgi:glycosyltransferase involved in cell wall biosynthesis